MREINQEMELLLNHVYHNHPEVYWQAIQQLEKDGTRDKILSVASEQLPPSLALAEDREHDRSGNTRREPIHSESRGGMAGAEVSNQANNTKCSARMDKETDDSWI